MDRTHNKTSYRNPKVFNMPFEEPKKRPKKVWKPILFLVIIGGLYYFIFQSSFFRIKNIIIDQNLPPPVSDYMKQYKGENIFALKSSEIREGLLAKYPELTHISVIRGIPDSIKVACSERVPKLVWESNATLYLLDENGIAYKQIQDSGSLPKVQDNKNLSVKENQLVVSKNFIDFITELKPKLESNNFVIDHFEVNETTFQIDALTDKGLILKFDITRLVDSQISDLVKFWEKYSGEAQSYIDLRVEGKVFYK